MKAREIMGVLYVICLGLVLPIGANAQPIEWPVSEGGSGHFYEFQIGDYSTSWAEQHLFALTQEFNGMQGHLATITSAAENAWITEHLFAGVLPRQSVVYLGGWNDGFLTTGDPCFYSGSQGWHLGSWRWITGEPWEYGAWAEGEPSGDAATGCTTEFALSYLYFWEVDWQYRTGFNNLPFEYHVTGAFRLVEYDGLATIDLPPLDHPISTQSSTWGALKTLYR